MICLYTRNGRFLSDTDIEETQTCRRKRLANRVNGSTGKEVTTVVEGVRILV